MINIFIENGYPVDLIFRTIHKRLFVLIRRNTIASEPATNDDNAYNFFIIPFVGRFSNDFKAIITNDNTRLAITNLKYNFIKIGVHVFE